MCIMSILIAQGTMEVHPMVGILSFLGGYWSPWFGLDSQCSSFVGEGDHPLVFVVSFVCSFLSSSPNSMNYEDLVHLTA